MSLRNVVRAGGRIVYPPMQANALRQRNAPYYPYEDDLLTITGGLITDAVREAGDEGDGLTPPAGVGVRPAATNLVTNGGFETNTTGWEATGATIARSTAAAKFGSASLRATVAVAADLAGARQATSIAASTGTVVSASAWMRYVTTTANVQLLIVEYDSGNNFLRVGGTSGSLALTDEFAQASVTVTLGASTTQIRVWAVTFGSQEADFYIDGVQVETGSIATPYIETDGGTAARLAGRVQVPSDLINETQSWIAFRVKMGWASNAPPAEFLRLWHWADDANNEMRTICSTSGAAQNFTLRRESGGVGTSGPTVSATFGAGDSITYIAAWEAARLRAAINGGAFSNAVDANIPNLAAALFDLGRDTLSATLFINSTLLWVATGTGALVGADSSGLHAIGDTPPTTREFYGALDHPATAEPTGLWDAVSETFKRFP